MSVPSSALARYQLVLSDVERITMLGFLAGTAASPRDVYALRGAETSGRRSRSGYVFALDGDCGVDAIGVVDLLCHVAQAEPGDERVLVLDAQAGAALAG